MRIFLQWGEATRIEITDFTFGAASPVVDDLGILSQPGPPAFGQIEVGPTGDLRTPRFHETFGTSASAEAVIRGIEPDEGTLGTSPALHDLQLSGAFLVSLTDDTVSGPWLRLTHAEIRIASFAHSAAGGAPAMIPVEAINPPTTRSRTSSAFRRRAASLPQPRSAASTSSRRSPARSTSAG